MNHDSPDWPDSSGHDRNLLMSAHSLHYQEHQSHRSFDLAVQLPDQVYQANRRSSRSMWELSGRLPGKRASRVSEVVVGRCILT
jgi:hypothetical protein